mmetsp:Transcript_39295/g.73327  ORF Transcript_39295/g.73327 Transcript_39295/m.73327 type:complete len:179 (-) Transcript_39295:33-569(-)
MPKDLPDLRNMFSLKVDVSGKPPSKWTAEDLKDEFSRFGEVGDVFIPRSKFSDRPCGYAFVRFFDERDGMEAVKTMNRSNYDGCLITVAKAQVARGEQKSGGGGRSSPRRRSRDRSRDKRRRERSRSRSSRPRRRSPTPVRKRARSQSRSPSRRSRSDRRARRQSRERSRSRSDSSRS